MGLMSGWLTGCSEAEKATDKGRLTVKMTDAPFPADLISEANITINKIEIRQAGEADEQEGEAEDHEDKTLQVDGRDKDDDNSPFVTLSEEELEINVFELRNGVTENLAEVEIPVGSYNLIRLYVSHASVTLTNGETYNLKVPSGAQTGIKIFVAPAIEVAGGLSAELLLDFDISKSFVVQGNMDTPAGINGFIFKPVLRAVNTTTAGRVQGHVADTTAAIADVQVWLEKDTIVTSTFTDQTGNYVLMGIPAGTYEVFATAENYDTLTVSDLQVVAGNATTQDFDFSDE